MEKYFSLAMSLVAGILLVEGYVFMSIVFIIVAIYGTKGLLFQ